MAACAFAGSGLPRVAPGQVASLNEPPGPELRLWQEIQALSSDPAASQPYTERLITLPERCAALIEHARRYQVLYPGGRHVAEAVALELNALFEAGSLRSGDFEQLRARLDELEAAPGSDAVRAEAAYWRILCVRAERTRAATQPASAPVLAPDPALLAACREYIAAHPGSRHALRMSTLLFEDAQVRGDRVAMRAIVDWLVVSFPSERTTVELAAALRRADAVGQPFWLTGRTTAGDAIDTRSYADRPVLIVVWATFEPASAETLAAIERRRSMRPEIAVVGVCLDDTPADVNAAMRSAGAAWPQILDGLGWGGDFVTAWNVRRIPMIFVIDRAGRLVGATAGGEWSALLDAALAPT
jgi:hypothetical protein